MFNEHSQEPEDQGSLRRLRGLSVWALLLSLAWLVYELTVDPALAAVVACGKVGWNDLRTAWWLYQRDPMPPRGGVYLVFYIASALWRIAVAATIVTVVAVIMVAILESFRDKAVDNLLLPVFAKAALEMSVAYVLCTLATAVAIGLAWHHGLRLWLDPAFHRSRRENRWPPEFHSRNRANRLIVTALVVIVLGTTTMLAVILQDRLPRAAPVAGQPAHDMRATLVILSECTGIFVGWVTWRAVNRRVFASNYDECWVPLNDSTDSQTY